MKLFNRTSEEQEKAWTYFDEDEANFVFEMELVGLSVSSMDDYIEDDDVPEGIRNKLLENRHEAFHDYKQGKFELAVAKIDALNAKCLYYGLALGAKPILDKRQKFKRSSKAAGIVSGKIRRLSAALPLPSELRKAQRELIASGTELRYTAGILAERYGCSAKHVRKTLKKP